MRYVGADVLKEVLPMKAAVDALDAAFAGEEIVATPPRAHVDVPDGTLLLMPAAGEEGVGVKLVTLNPGNPERGLPFIHGVYVLFAPRSLEPRCIIDGGALTGLRTAAVSGVATRHLAREDASRLVLFGAGIQAHAHLHSMHAVRGIRVVVVVSRTPERAEQLAGRARDLGLDARSGDPGAVADADVVCTCTTSSEPVFDGALLPPGAHVNAVGAYQPHARELDDAAVTRAKIVVETREAALEEAGDLLIPIESGVITKDHIVAELGDVVRGAAVRTADQDVMVFKSVGVAFEDLAIARAVVERMDA